MPSVLLPSLSKQIKLVCCPVAVQMVFRSSKLLAACQIVEPEDEEEVGPTSSPGYSNTLRWSLVQVKTHQKMKQGMVYEVPCKGRAGLHCMGKWAGPYMYMHVGGWPSTRWQEPQLEQRDSSPHLVPTAHVGSQPRSWHQLPTAGREGYERPSTSNHMDINELGMWSV